MPAPSTCRRQGVNGNLITPNPASIYSLSIVFPHPHLANCSNMLPASTYKSSKFIELAQMLEFFCFTKRADKWVNTPDVDPPLLLLDKAAACSVRQGH
jgi:hypothetical protein